MTQFKTTTQLFYRKYQYKIVVVCPGAHLFRSGLDQTLDYLKGNTKLNQLPDILQDSAKNLNKELDDLF